MITEKKIVYLFDEVWPAMEYCAENRNNCLSLFPLIEKQFLKHKLDFDSLLEELIKYDGIGITIATGLIWVSYQGRAVPFDKYTTNWALQKKYIKTNRVSDNYKSICKKIITELKGRRKPIKVFDFIREARQEVEYLGYTTLAV